MYLLIKYEYIKSVLWRVARCLSYVEEARCLKVNGMFRDFEVYSASLSSLRNPLPVFEAIFRL